MPRTIENPITSCSIAWSRPPCLHQVELCIIHCFPPPADLKSILIVNSWPSASPLKLGLLLVTPLLLLQILCCHSNQPGLRWGTLAHLRLRPVHYILVWGLPCVAPTTPGLGLTCWLGWDTFWETTVPFLFGFCFLPHLKCPSKIICTIQVTLLRLDNVPTVCLLSVSCSTASRR